MTEAAIIPKSEWEWFGAPAHFICARWCRFHMVTLIGSYVVSTVGEYVHPRNSGGGEQAEAEWLRKNWPGEDIGCDRKYETMVFRMSGRCDSETCGCGHPFIDTAVLDTTGYNTAKDANHGHRAMCDKWADPANWPSGEEG